MNLICTITQSSSMHQASISVVLCTYNGSAFIDEQVASILAQQYQPSELIIQDDCSTDDTWDKLLQWQQRSPLIRLFRNEQNLGYNKNFEQVIQRATGDFIAISDQDDIWLPEKFTRLLPAFTNEEVVLAHNRSVRLENGHLDYRKSKLQHHFSGNDTRKLFFFNQIMGHDMLFRKSLVQHIIPIPPGMSYDWWIAVVATCYGTVASVEDYLVHHRIHGQNNYFTKSTAARKKELDLDATLQLFAAIPALKPTNKAYLNRLLQLLQQKQEKPGFNGPFFFFLYRNRKIIFGHKRRAIPELSYFKNSIKYAKLDFRGKGISF